MLRGVRLIEGKIRMVDSSPRQKWLQSERASERPVNPETKLLWRESFFVAPFAGARPPSSQAANFPRPFIHYRHLRFFLLCLSDIYFTSVAMFFLQHDGGSRENYFNEASSSFVLYFRV
jgi:hypothetical protein